MQKTTKTTKEREIYESLQIFSIFCPHGLSCASYANESYEYEDAAARANFCRGSCQKRTRNAALEINAAIRPDISVAGSCHS